MPLDFYLGFDQWIDIEFQNINFSFEECYDCTVSYFYRPGVYCRFYVDLFAVQPQD